MRTLMFVTFALLVTSICFGQTSELKAFLEENNLPADTVEAILQQETQKGPDFSEIVARGEAQADVLQRRKVIDAKAVALSASLAAAGVTFFFLPLPGSELFAVVLLKGALGVALTVTGTAASGVFLYSASEEIFDFSQLKKALVKQINVWFHENGLDQKLGHAVQVFWDRSHRLVKITTDKGFLISRSSENTWMADPTPLRYKLRLSKNAFALGM